MLRGAKKNMIVVRTRDSRMFEEAYFVMRRDAKAAEEDDLSILWEANRILESARPGALREPEGTRRGGRRLRWRDLAWFGAGLLSGGGIAGLLLLLF